MDIENRLQVSNLSCLRQDKPLFTGLHFALQPGEALLVEGANGSGKSSLLRLLAGLATPNNGDILWRDQPIQQLRADYWHELHYLGHLNGLKLGLTVSENLHLTAQLCTHHPIFEKELSIILARLQLTPCLQQLAKHLSAGQKRRVALAKIMLIAKPLWLLDEPLTALDADTQSVFLSCLEQHLQQGGMAVISSHHSFTLKTTHRVQKLRIESAC
jgi:heme exporter protein A